MKTFYFRHRDGIGHGTESDPFSPAQFDPGIVAARSEAPNEEVTIDIGPGEFFTRGIAPGKNWTIRGAGMGKTILKLLDVGATGFHTPDNYVISTAYYGIAPYPDAPAWANSLHVSDLTLDAQWPIQSARAMANMKFGAVFGLVTRGTAARVHAVNWGSNGLNLAASEAFPIMFETASIEQGLLIIEDCIVTGQHRHDGGYATAFNIVTTQDRLQGTDWVKKGDQCQRGERRSLAGIVRRNLAIGIYGHGLGCGHAENVVFEDNIVLHSKTGFNCDTGFNRKIQLRGNHFLNCNQGAWIGNEYSGEFVDFELLDNQMLLSGPWLNERLNPVRTEYSYAARLSGHTNRTRIAGNVVGSSAASASFTKGSYGIGLATATDLAMTAASNTFTRIPKTVRKLVPVYRP